MDLKYVVTGTGRCGTLFMANLLTSMGLPCTHEAVFTTEGWDYAWSVMNGLEPAVNSRISQGDNLSDYEIDLVAESSYMAAPFISRMKVGVIHVVRNPFKVIGSLVGYGFRQFSKSSPTEFEDDPYHFKYEKFIYENLPELGEEKYSQIDRACLFYVRWNGMIEKSGRVELFHRIEDGTEQLRKHFQFDGECYENTSCNSSAEKSRNWSLSEIKNREIKDQFLEMTERYGYKSEIRKRMIF
jgi:hypothetical protein